MKKKSLLVCLLGIPFCFLLQNCIHDTGKEVNCENVEFKKDSIKLQVVFKNQSLIDYLLTDTFPYNYQSYSNIVIEVEKMNLEKNYNFCNFIKSCESDPQYQIKSNSLSDYSIFNDIINKLDLAVTDSNIIKCLIKKFNISYFKNGEPQEELNKLNIDSFEAFHKEQFKIIMDSYPEGVFEICQREYQLKSIGSIKSNIKSGNSYWYFVSRYNEANFLIYEIKYRVSGNKLIVENLKVINPVIITNNSLYRN